MLVNVVIQLGKFTGEMKSWFEFKGWRGGKPSLLKFYLKSEEEHSRQQGQEVKCTKVGIYLVHSRSIR